jgi:hypothetical protein
MLYRGRFIVRNRAPRLVLINFCVVRDGTLILKGVFMFKRFFQYAREKISPSYHNFLFRTYLKNLLKLVVMWSIKKLCSLTIAVRWGGSINQNTYPRIGILIILRIRIRILIMLRIWNPFWGKKLTLWTKTFWGPSLCKLPVPPVFILDFTARWKGGGVNDSGT